MDFKIEKAQIKDVDEILEIYEHARSFMRENGNASQWQSNYPSRETVLNDIEHSQLYVERPSFGGRGIACVFVFFIGLDPSYLSIEGSWKNDAVYGVVHRIATAKWAVGMGAAAFCLDYAFKLCGNLRIDTHEDNIPMQNLIAKCGFERCGIVHMADDGTPRIAYQKAAKLILASSSPRRIELMKKLRLPYYAEPAKREEILPNGLPVEKAAEYLSERKASEVFEKYKNEGVTVIGSDTVVIFDGKIYGKPKDEGDAKRMLRELSGNTHEVHTGVTIMRDDSVLSFTNVSLVSFYELSESDIERYVATGEPLDKAGAYGIQDEGALIVRRIEGDFFSIMGFPISEINKRLKSSIF